MTGFGTVANAKYVQLTTVRKDGTPVASPLWVAVDGDRLVMWTVADSWKVKRLRRDPRVIVQACDRRGHTLTGAPVEGTAEILDGPAAKRVGDLMVKKYGILGRIMVGVSTLRRGANGTVGLAITAK